MNIAGFIVSLGEPTTDKAFQSMQRLIIPCILIENITPFCEAINSGMDKLRDYEYILKSDADILIKDSALTKMIIALDEKVGMVAGKVVYSKDSLLFGQAGHIKLFRMKTWEDVGKYRYELASERRWVKRMKSKGWNLKLLDTVCGTDIRRYTVLGTIKKFHRQTIKERNPTQNHFKFCITQLVHACKAIYLSRIKLGSILAFLGTLLSILQLPFDHSQWFVEDD